MVTWFGCWIPSKSAITTMVIYLKHFRHYLYARKFTLRTDHSSLRWLSKVGNFIINGSTVLLTFLWIILLGCLYCIVFRSCLHMLLSRTCFRLQFSTFSYFKNNSFSNRIIFSSLFSLQHLFLCLYVVFLLMAYISMVDDWYNDVDEVLCVLNN